MDDKDKHVQGIKKSLETIIGTDLTLKRKRKNEDDINRDLFEKIINALDKAYIRSVLVEKDLDIDLTSYDETFYEAIDNLFLLHFGKEASELIYFYLYERIDPDGTVNELEDVNGNPLILNSPMDLWNVIHMLKHIK